MIFQFLLYFVVYYTGCSTASQLHPLLIATELNQGTARSYRNLPLRTTDGSPCDQVTFRTCVNEFSTEVGVSSTSNLHVDHIVEQLDRVYKNEGAEGFKRSCQASYTLKICLSDMLENCMSVPNLIQQVGHQPLEAVEYVNLAKQLEYQCGRNYDYILNYWDCLSGDYSSEIRSCLDGGFGSCENNGGIAQCYTRIMTNHCGKIVGGLACGTMQRGLEATSVAGCSQFTCPRNLVVDGPPRIVTHDDNAEAESNRRLPLVLRKSHLEDFQPEEDDLSVPPENDNMHHRCDRRKLARCTKQYFRNLGLKMPRSATGFVKELSELANREGKSGFMKICRAGHTLGHCMGREARSCFSVRTLIHMGVSKIDAIIYNTVGKVLAFECGPAYQTFLENYGCIKRTAVSANATEMRCVRDFQKRIKQHPDKKCMYLQKLIDCALPPFGRACGQEVSRDICIVDKIALRASMPKCHIRCGHHDPRSQPPGQELSEEAIEGRHPHLVKKVFTHPQNIDTSKPVESISTQIDGMCDETTYMRCTRNYFRTLGMEVPSTASELARGMFEFSTRNPGKPGFIKMCSASRVYGKCLGSNWRSCFSVSALVHRGISKEDALVFNITAQSLGYECTTGYDTLVQNYECINNTLFRSQAIEKKCTDDFFDAMQKHPENKCMELQKFIGCSIAPVSRSCSQRTGHVMCELDSISAKLLLPDCSVQCTTSGSPTVQSIERKPHVIVSHAIKVISRHSKPAHRIMFESSTSTACDSTTYTRCSTQLARTLHMQSMPKNPTVFMIKLSEMLKTKNGFTTFCNSVNTMRSCLGTKVEPCMSVDHFQEMGISKENAVMFAAIFAQFTDECGPDYQTVYDNYDCIIRVVHRYNHSIEHCAHDFERFVKHDPEHACHFAQEFVMCVTKPFKDHCNADVGRALCNAEAAALDTVYSQCHVTCNPRQKNHYLSEVHDHNELLQKPRVSNQTPKTTNQCNKNRFTRALKLIGRAVNVRDLPNDPHVFSKQVQRFLHGDVYEKRFARFCNGIRVVSKVLGNSAESCMSVRNLMTMEHLTWFNATGYHIFYKQSKYECGAGYQTFMEHGQCLMHIADTFKASLDMCKHRISESLKGGDPSQICNAAQEFANCWLQPFTRHCAPEAAQSLCNTVKLNLEYKSGCTVTCPN